MGWNRRKYTNGVVAPGHAVGSHPERGHGKGVLVASRSVELLWLGEGLRFRGAAEGESITMSGLGDPPGLGPGPMQLLLLALGGCTGMDVVAILRKMRQPLEELRVEVRGEQAEEHPREYTSMEIVYRLKGDLDEGRVARAIELSETRYCSVEATLRDAVPISSRYIIEG
jgi:putative redox protein